MYLLVAAVVGVMLAYVPSWVVFKILSGGRVHIFLPLSLLVTTLCMGAFYALKYCESGRFAWIVIIPTGLWFSYSLVASPRMSTTARVIEVGVYAIIALFAFGCSLAMGLLNRRDFDSSP